MSLWRSTLLAGAVGTGLLAATAWPVPAQVLPDVVDCEGPAPDAEPGSAAWQLRDLENMFCAEQRHLDQALHPTLPLPVEGLPVVPDAYREPSLHDGVRFRFDATTIDGLDAEVYRPCGPGDCPELPAGLERHEPPYPAIVIFHGGASYKELHWWSSQPLAEAGYLVVAFKSEGERPTIDEAERMLAWLYDSGDPLTADFDREHVGIAGHSGGGVVVNTFGQVDARVDAIVAWDRAQSSVLPEDLPLRTPALYVTADYNCQQVPICQPEPYLDAPDPDGPGNKGQDFEQLRAAGVDTMKIALRAALHLDWTGGELQGNRWAELVSVYVTLAWFDRWVRGATDPGLAADAFARLTAEEFDDSADRHNISQGFFDPAAAAASADPYAGNVPYTLAELSTADRLSFYFLSKCSLTEPETAVRFESDDLRARPCAATSADVPDANPPDSGQPPMPDTGGGAAVAAVAMAIAAVVSRARRHRPSGVR